MRHGWPRALPGGGGAWSTRAVEAGAVDAEAGAVRGGPPGGGARSTMAVEAGLPSSSYSSPLDLVALDLVCAAGSQDADAPLASGRRPPLAHLAAPSPPVVTRARAPPRR
jgi:hypothetical protein